MGGWGDQCKAWAKQHSNFCNMHAPPEIVSEEDKELMKELKRLFPKLYKKKLRCICSAYPFPHFIGTGICNWPDPPSHRFILKADPSLKGKNPEKEAKELLRRLGIKNKNTSFIKRFRIGKVVPIKPEDLKPQDFTLLEDYMKDFVELEDWNSLPLDEKRKRLKEQMVEVLRREYGFKHCLKNEYPNEVRIENSADSKTPHEVPLHYKIIKEKERQRNGEIKEKAYMILETGERIPLE
jgi:hypothetical protein